MKDKTKASWRMLAIALVLILTGSFLASMLHTSFFQVKISEIEFDTERGTLNGLLYMPKGAGEDDPRPVIVTTHGYLNTKEMQDAPAIEMSRRGYIVLALDMYDHGDSRWAADIPVGGQFGTFWIYSQFDAANYMAQQPYTKHDENGNAYVAVSGHSMGGFSTLVSMYLDEMNALQTGTRSIYAGISVGADFSYASALAPQEEIMAAFGDRTVGMICAHYDEFFFNKSEEEKTEAEKKIQGTVTYKDFAATNSGKMFLGVAGQEEAANAGEFYTVASGDVMLEGKTVRASQDAQHIIYTPNETHPWNHFSGETTGNLIDFYAKAFEGVTSPNQANADLPASSQIWFWKEVCNLIAMIGFFLLIVPLASLLLQAPFFKMAVTEEVPVVAAPKNNAQKAAFWISIAASVLYPAVLFPTLMDKQASGLNVLFILSCIACVGGCIVAAVSLRKDQKGQACAGGGAAIVSLIAALVFCFAGKILPLSQTFNEPTTNQIAYWAIACGLIALIILLFFYALSKKAQGTQAKDYGVRLNVKAIAASFCTAVTAVAAAYLLLFLIQGIFGTDFRFWTLAVRTFKTEHLITALKYMPFFFIYYAINVVALNANTREKRFGTLFAVLLNIGGLLLWMALQYGLDFATGKALYPNQALNGILLFATVPCLGVAAVYAKKLFGRTNNVWLASFVNTMLFTMITAANTALFWNMVP